MCDASSVFKMSACTVVLACMVRGFQWIPVIFINSVIVWSYYAYVFVLCFENVQSNIEKAAYLVAFHPFFFMLIISYWRTILADQGIVPSQFALSKTDKDLVENGENVREVLTRVSKNLPTATRTLSGGVRYCDICCHIKPDRCHHCSMCRKCILKMDHHCPWVNNCVGYSNYKFFLLFLFYAILYTFYVTGTVTKYFIAFWSNSLEGEGKLHILFLFFVALMFCISLWSLFGYHIYLVSQNKTTLESFRVPHLRYGPSKDAFHLGTRLKNVEQVFGTSVIMWFLPVFTSPGDGVNFPLKHSPESDRLLDNGDRWMEEGDLEEQPTTVCDGSAELRDVNELEPTVAVTQNIKPDLITTVREVDEGADL
ncbi:palmitoyltransferase ZDHHC15B isoform X2 [Nematostella vectensis]|uniref:palmitoyltransferase ZDHHC15B isoform X2 n=1 Tax=Nematostella vectensis TaxID=45351 RepID=UPI0020771B98|nr:palmitoyltransferase ZDHHC15B isoform X2 [Nematostella vectensis]